MEQLGFIYRLMFRFLYLISYRFPFRIYFILLIILFTIYIVYDVQAVDIRIIGMFSVILWVLNFGVSEELNKQFRRYHKKDNN